MRNEASGKRKSGSMVKDKKLDTKTERTSGKSGSVEKIGFGLAQKNRTNEGKEEVEGHEGGRGSTGGRAVGTGEGRKDRGIRWINWSVERVG